jgi:hypothetical protein
MKLRSLLLKYLSISCLSTIFLSGCGTTPTDVPLDQIDLKTDISRFDLLQHQATEAFKADSTADPLTVYMASLGKDKKFVAEFLGLRTDTLIPDTSLANFFAEHLSHRNFQELLDTIAIAFPPGSGLEASFIPPLKRLHHHFPDQKIPAVRTFASGFTTTAQGMDQVIFTPHYLGVGLHYFLGAHFPYYPPDLPMFMRKRCTPNHVLTVTFGKIGERIIAPEDLNKQPILIDQMMRAGISLAFLDKLLPDTPDSLKIFYSPSQMKWAEENEAQVYKYMIENLYSTDVEVHRDYVDEAPFTSGFSRESPPRLGQYIGWMIVRSFMAAHPEVTIAELMKRKDYDQIFQESEYKPEK